MNDAESLHIPASRLRVGDRVVAHAKATVAQPPIVSPDGAMLTALLDPASSEPNTPLRVLRVPIDQPVEVLRPLPLSKKMVRKSKTAKSSGAQIVVMDLRQPDTEFAPIDGNNFATLCASHHSIQFHANVSTADAISSHPEEWCPDCADATRERAQSRVIAPNVARRLA